MNNHPKLPRSLDGFQLLSAVLAVVAGPIMLLTDWPTVWGVLVFGGGMVLLLAQWAIVMEIHGGAWTDVAVGVVALACLCIAVVYLTKRADDLPRLLPGHDGDSDHVEMVAGFVMLLLGGVGLGRTALAVQVTRVRA